MDDPATTNDYTRQYENQVVLLTGATGSLGGCLLYKLALRLPTKKIYALCRRSIGDAIRKWESTMPQQIEDILDSGKVEFITGDLSKPGLGLETTVCEGMRNEVTAVINTAANISLVQDLEESLQNNCQTAIALLQTASGFKNVQLFIHFSSLAVNSFLSGGLVEERLYPSPDDIPNPEGELAGLPGADPSRLPPDDRYTWPYAQAKHLAERLLLRQPSPVPVLIIRPSAIGPALAEPFPLYGPDSAIPLHQMLLSFTLTDQDLERMAMHHDFEEVPVDLVANCCLVHLANRTTGVVHCSSELYVTRTGAEVLSTARDCITPVELAEVFRKQRAAAAFMWQNKYRLDQIDQTPTWTVECKRSDYQKQLTGPLALVPAQHDAQQHLRRRIRKMYRVMLDSPGEVQ
ncbi:male sterility protein-domain-containing protein [Aspergillus carlsbadensis]|nr:male sterility protein-domain-containing protein [Aspergillus carlsbadensis]